MFAGRVSELFAAVDRELERDPGGGRIGDALERAIVHATEFLDSGAAPSAAASEAASTAPPAEPAVDVNAPPPAPPDAEAPATAPDGEDDVAAEPQVSESPTVHKCPQCGTYYTGPTTCANQHEPADTVELDEVPAPVDTGGNAGDPAGDAGVDPAAPAAGPGSPDWPAGSE
jgi:hypothetical protein